MPAAAKQSHDNCVASKARALRARTRRLAANASAAVLHSSSAATLTPSALGALMALCQYAASRERFFDAGSRMSERDAYTALEARGMGVAERTSALSALRACGLLILDDGTLSVPAFDEALAQRLLVVENRAAGWQKRGGKPLISAAPAAPAAPPVQASLDVVTPIPAARAAVQQAPAGVAKARRIPLEGGIFRLGESDVSPPPADEPTLVRIQTKGGGIVEVTQPFLDSLTPAYPALDVLHEIRGAAVWCAAKVENRKTFKGFRGFIVSWLNRAKADAAMRSAIVRVNSQRNGFGQGGSYGPAEGVAPQPNVLADAADELDELGSLLSARSSPDVLPASRPLAARAEAEPPVVASAHQTKRPNPVFAARMGRNGINRVSQAQRRLSDALGAN